jgi:ABC-2 type transport system ATP-binding protein
MKMKEVILKTYNITKKYGNQVAVNNVNMTIKKGEIYGFIGQNGAGKTTLIRLITGLIHKTGGEIELLGDTGEEELNKARTVIGSLIETPSFYTNMTARENLEVSRLVRNIPGKKCIDEVLELVGLKDVEKKKVKNFSLGMRQRLGIANALMGNPKLLILDEPINGLDPMGIVEIRELLKKINKEKDMTILISSHILSELSELATTYGIISNGKLIEEITAEELAEKCRQYIDLKVDDTSRAVTLLERELGISDYEVLEDKKIKVFSNLENIGEVNSILSKSGVIVESISIKGENLEEYFMNKIGGVLNA